jgi:hypothetical protein
VIKYPFTEGRVYEDNAVVPAWLCSCTTIAEIPYPLYFYQENPDGTTKGKISEKYLDFLWAVEEQLKYYQKIGYKKMFDKTYGMYQYSLVDRYKKAEEMNDTKAARKKILKSGWQTWGNYRKYAKDSNTLAKLLISLLAPGVVGIFHSIKKRIKR